jgi:hypothetical protein
MVWTRRKSRKFYNSCTDLNSAFPSKPIHGKTALETECQCDDHNVSITTAPFTINEPNTAPPEKVELIAPMMALVLSVLKKFKKLGESMT